jgi:HEAT repeat protein
MADVTGKKLVLLLQNKSSPEVRAAAALVMGEIGSRDTGVSSVLCDCMDDPDATVRAEVVAAIGKLRVEPALPRLLKRVQEGGPEAQLAAQAAAQLGARGTHALQDLMGKVAPGLRRRIASALAAAGTASAETAAVDVLLDKDPNVIDAAARSLIAKVPSLEARHRKALVDQVLSLVGTKKKSLLSVASEAALIRLLGALEDNRSAAVLWSRVEPAHPPEIRSSALQALGATPFSGERDKLKKLLVCAADIDFRVAAPALMMLKNAPVQERTLDEWLPLWESADPAARRFAIEKLGGKDHPGVAAGLVRQLDYPDPSLREQALSCLVKLDHGREILTDQLLESTSVDHAWALAKTQAPFARQYSQGLWSRIFARACLHLEAGDRRADALLFLLREANGSLLRDQLEGRAMAWRKKKRYETALIYLRLLARDPACGEAIRFELAACGLKVSGQDLAAEARTGDACLHQFAGLIHRHEINPLDWLQKAKWLGPEDLFYVGFHFIEGSRQEREFGADVLRLLLKKFARSKQAKDARNKLRSQGFE